MLWYFYDSITRNMCCALVFVFKQNTAYELRMSDWSSDVCSSDLRFEKAIDRAAMRAKLTGTDAYLEHWRRGAPAPCGEDLDAEAATAARRLESDYDDARLTALVAAGGQGTA